MQASIAHQQEQHRSRLPALQHYRRQLENNPKAFCSALYACLCVVVLHLHLLGLQHQHQHQHLDQRLHQHKYLQLIHLNVDDHQDREPK